jgi:FtsP/CotA-like multicopper oxidase with cupredoxin domain
MVLALLEWGSRSAFAGPGGGTYYANSPAGGLSGTALRKFVDSLPGVGAANANNLGQYIPLAVPDTAAYPGSDYYEIGLKDYTKKMHSDLPKATRLRGYYQVNGPDTTNQYLGPLILAKKDRPVRVKFTNQLPAGVAGNLFIPVDTSLMGAGLGPLGAAGGEYTQNRATIHLHGGNSPWISDGTPHQWTAPVGETSPYKKGVSARDVPDMPATTDGQLTFYWTNQQSGRLMFFHDHTYGITRLNVYAGEAAGYLITDPVEEALINNGTLPNVCPGGGAAVCEYRYGIPLVIQDKTFVPQDIDVQDKGWNYYLTSNGGPRYTEGGLRDKVKQPWGSYGDLWFPHVYEANQDPTSPAGANPFGRWDYGPWFWPPVIVDPAKSALPDPSTSPEAFMDTPIINGTAYPYLVVEPKPYRFRILNACNDRMLNLSLFYADMSDGVGSEMKMVAAAPNPNYPAGPFPEVAVWPSDGRAGGVPDPTTMGPNIIQIGSESGFIPYPVVHPNQPINYNYNRRDIVVLNVQEKNLFLGPAERADIIIDFSSVPAGSKLILYNDSPAPVPAGDPRLDYYTGNPDQSASGGAPSTQRGFGPNTRTIMQFRVAGAPSAAFNLANLQAALPVAFKNTQPVPVVPQPTYPVTSGGNAPTEMYAKIQDYSITLTPIGSTVPATIPFQPKAIQELWDPYGRMNATLGVELPFTSNLIQTTIPMGYAEPATERVVDGHVQIWKITHNGVDTHPVHFHMFDVQVVNRVGWDGAIRPPDDNELGWKETVRMNPLEDIIVALRPKAQTLPFAIGTSVRPIDPSLPASAIIASTDFSNPRNPVAANFPNVPVANPLGYDFGYEYVWHCHILGHEENDFMRPVIFSVSTTQAPQPTGLTLYPGGATVPGLPNYVTSYVNSNINQIVLQWVDGAPVASPSEFLIERDSGGGFVPLTTITYLPGYPPIFTDTAVAQGITYSYRVRALNAFMNSLPSNVATLTTANWPPATGLTLAASKPTPHAAGTNVQFTAAASGAVLNPNPNNLSIVYQYRFWLNDGTGMKLVQDYSANNNWTMSDLTPVGNYTVTVDVRTSPSAPLGYDVRTSIPYVIVPTPIAPVTSASPVAGIYAAAPVQVTLSATGPAPPNTIYYTIDGTTPTTASTKYTVPIVINATTTIKYFAVDVNGTAEVLNIGTWTIHTADLTASVLINNGAVATNATTVNLSLSATDPAGVATMQFSNDGVNYTAEEPYNAHKSWAVDWSLLAPIQDGPKTVYVKFRDGSLPVGVQYGPYTANITLDRVQPVTTPSPLPGTYATASNPLMISLTPSETATVYYTIDGTTPTTASNIYTGPLALNATTTIKYFAVDLAGNVEPVKSGTWTFHTSDLVASIQINNGAVATNSNIVTLTLSAVDPAGVATMQFSNDGITYSAEENYATSKLWPLTTGDGNKTVYVRFRDMTQPNGVLYPPITANIILDTVTPATIATPIPGAYSAQSIQVTLTADEPATIHYTTDGSIPTILSSVYTTPINVTTQTVIKYFAVDPAGNVETYKSGTWTPHTPDMVRSVKINNGASYTNVAAVTLNLTAVDPSGVDTMQFSNDGTNYTNEEPYAATKAWNLQAGDGPKTVYVRFRDKTLPSGYLYPPVIASITLDTRVPITTVTPVAGTYSAAPVTVTLAANEPATIYYTIDGTTPTIASTKYTGPITVNATTTIKYFAVDLAGNTEAVQTNTWAIHISDLIASIKINNGATTCGSTAVTLTLAASDPVGVATMQFSNDGVNYSTEETYATNKPWTLTSGNGVKTVYVRFRDASLPTGNLYEPIAASITLVATKDGLLPGTTTFLSSALKAMQIATGMATASQLDMDHGDVAPYSNGQSKPDGKIDLLDVYILLLRQMGIITSF